jgi:hypothetical protein
VPTSWRTTSYPDGLQFRDPATGRTLRVTSGTGQPDAVADRRAAAASFSRRYPTYAQVRIDPVGWLGATGADWEFTYSDGGAQLHVLDRVADVGGTGYSLFFQTRAADWAGAQGDLQAALAAFRPAGG